jgi:hypothetical protein
LPLIEGSVRASILDAEKPFQALLNALSTPKADSNHIRLSDGASIIVVIQNPLLVRHCRTKDVTFGINPDNKGSASTLSAVNATDINNEWMERMLQAAERSSDENVKSEKFYFEPHKYTGVKTIASQLSASTDLRKFEKSVNKSFLDFTGITGEAI